MDSDSDLYERWYSEKLWNLLPAIYRAEDSEDFDKRGPLEEVVTRIGAQMAEVRRSVDRLWEDQSIETCDDWLIDYLGDLVATNLVASLDARGRRLDVRKTIYYRRRKGTVALLEELATDITGWGARVVEFFRRLGRTRHGLDPAIGIPALPAFSAVTHTGASTGTLRLGGAPLDNHSVSVHIDVAGQAGTASWSTSIDGGDLISHGTASTVTLDAPGGGTITITLVNGGGAPSFRLDDMFSFAVSVDPVARLQRAQGLVGARTHTGVGGLADLRDVHGAALTNTAFDEFFHTADVRRGRGATGWHDIPRLGVFLWRLRSLAVEQVTPVPVQTCPNQVTFDPTGRDIPLFAAGDRPSGDQWVSPEPHQLPGPITTDTLRYELAKLYRPSPETPDDPRSLAVYHLIGASPKLIPLSDIAADPRRTEGRLWIDAERGRVIWPAAPTDGPFLTSYHYGFSSEIGAGAFDRPPPAAPDDDPPPATFEITDPATILGGTGARTLELANSLTYPNVAPFAAFTKLVVRAGDQRRPLVRLPSATPEWTFIGDPEAKLTLDGLFLSGGDLVLDGTFDTVVLSCCTLDPGTWDPKATPPGWMLAADGPRLGATRLRIQGTVGKLIVDRCILGPIRTESNGRVTSLTIRESIVQAADGGDPLVFAIDAADSEVELSRCTVLGRARMRRLDVSESILHDLFTVDDCQHGCVRFSAWSTGSLLPRKYEGVEQPPLTALFGSLAFGQPAYAQLSTAGSAITEGAEDGSEMGAFWREGNAVKERSLLIKYQEYLPLGLEPVIVHVT